MFVHLHHRPPRGQSLSRRCRLPCRVCPRLEELEDRTAPAVFNVNSGDVATLIADINTANSNGQSNIINLQPGVYTLTAVNNYWYGPDGLPAISSNLTIQGEGGVILERSSASGTPAFRLFYVSGGLDGLPAGNLTLVNMTLANGVAQGGNSNAGGGGGNGGGGGGLIGGGFGVGGGGMGSKPLGGGGAGMGGAIFNMVGSLVLTDCTLTANTAQGGNGYGGGSGLGGGIFNLDGQATLNNTAVTGNTVVAGAGSNGSNGQADGAAVYNLAYGNNIQTGGAVTATLAFSNAILSGNHGSGDLLSLAVNGKNTNQAIFTSASNLVPPGGIPPGAPGTPLNPPPIPAPPPAPSPGDFLALVQDQFLLTLDSALSLVLSLAGINDPVLDNSIAALRQSIDANPAIDVPSGNLAIALADSMALQILRR